MLLRTPLLLLAGGAFVLGLDVEQEGGAARAVRLNEASLAALQTLTQATSQSSYSAPLDAADPEVQRMLGLLATQHGDLATADQHYRAALAGGLEQLPLIRAARPTADALAAFAHQLYPNDAETATWLGDALA